MLFKHTLKHYLILVSFSIILLVGCNHSYEYKTDGPFVTASVSPAGPDDFRNLIGEYISFYQDGTLVLSDGESNKLDKPILETQLNKKEVKEIQEKIEESNFRKLPDDVSAPAEDGAHYHIQANFVDDSKKVQGWNPVDEDFHELHHYLFTFIDEDDYTAWKTDMEEYMWEHHSLSNDDKEAYNEDGPFLTYRTEHHIAGDIYFSIYYTTITLDIDGNVVVFAEDKDNNKLTDVPIFKKTVDDDALAHFLETILENFWKLKENVSSDEGKKEEAITVFLTEEDKEVVGKEPDNRRFIQIKQEIIQLVDEDDLKQWQHEVEQTIIDNEDY